MAYTMMRNAKNSSLQQLSKIQFLFLPKLLIMQQNELFSILDSVESTNNYAMQQVHEGLAIHGQAWFAKEQWGGRGQRGKKWESTVGENLILSVIIKPTMVFNAKPFLLSAFIASVVRENLATYTSENIEIKWPNDIYCCDRKAGGILIENIYSGNKWKWAVVGIGININQTAFLEADNTATSLKKITNTQYDPILLAQDLHKLILQKLDEVTIGTVDFYLKDLNKHLYKKNEIVALKKENIVFKTKIIAVNEYGQLITEDFLDRKFEVGEIEWIIQKEGI
jgi:BirA family transcriptional regulator, biotin operon repressor / biotin---[acetyl-CoA-carboxylase] ligase